jgi:soluble lytic murein transglycosylase-like protein
MWKDLTLFYLILILGVLLLFHEKVGQVGVSVMGYVKGLYDDLYKKWGDLRGIPWQLIKAVAITESDENSNAIGDNGQAIGLMQVWHFHWEALGMTRDDMLDPNLNLQAGTAFLAEMVKKYGIYGGLEAYNEGEGNFTRGRNNPGYANNVLSHYYPLMNAEPVQAA